MEQKRLNEGGGERPPWKSLGHNNIEKGQLQVSFIRFSTLDFNIFLRYVNQKKILGYEMETGNFTVYVRVSIRKTFAQFLQKKAQIFAFVALHFARKKALCPIIAQTLFCAKLRYSAFMLFRFAQFFAK